MAKYYTDKYGTARCVHCHGTNLWITGCGDCWNAANLHPSRHQDW